jgi:catechol 2,3-dioxygenase-like lactoylglutathione lyase family enzyme
MRRVSIACALAVAAVGLSARAQAPQTLPYDHVHMAAPDPEKARDWYMKYLRGVPGESTERVAFEQWTGRRPLPVQFLFIKAPDAPPSEGSVIDSLGFSFSDVEAKARELEAGGATIRTPAREVPGLWKQAVVVDPFGVKIELVEDRELLGFHHIALRVANPEESLQWYHANFGGQRTKLRGRIDALQYGGMYLVILQGDGTAPSQGRAIDHLGFGPASIDTTAADLKGKGVPFTAGPQPKPNANGHRTGYVEGPGGVRIELVEHTECKWK